jgi:hypothetical protein
MQLLRTYRKLISSFMIILMTFWQICQPLQAATLYWDVDATATGNASSGTGLGGAGTWNTSNANWWNGVTPIDQVWSNSLNAGDTAVFSGTAGTVTLGAPITVGGLTFNVGGYTLAGGGNSLTLGTAGGLAPVVNATTGSTTITSNLVLGTNAYLGGAGSLTINTGVITDGGSNFGFTKFGAGALTLAGANTFGGGVNLAGGTTIITAANNLGSGGASNTLTFTGGTLQTSGTFNLGTTRGPIIGIGGAALDVTNTLTVDGALSVVGITGTSTAGGTVNLTKTNTGTLTFTNTSNSTALVNTIANAGTVSFGLNTTLGGGYVALNGATLQNTATTTMTNAIVLGASGGTIAVATGQTLTDSTAINGPGSLTVGTSGNTGTLKLTGAATYAGSTTVAFGT